jgi:hypothetical protein
MMMAIIFISVVIQLYYYSNIQDLVTSVKMLSSEVRTLRYVTSELSRGLDSYKSINVIIELQMRSMLVKMLRDMGFSESDIERILREYGYGYSYNYTAVVELEDRLSKLGFSESDIAKIMSVLEELFIIPSR